MEDNNKFAYFQNEAASLGRRESHMGKTHITVERDLKKDGEKQAL